MRFVLLTTLCVLHFAAAADVHFSKLVAERAVVPFDITLEYKNTNEPSYTPYDTCAVLNAERDPVRDDSKCPALTWDDDAYIRVTITPPAMETLAAATITKNDDETLGEPVKFKIQACYTDPYKKNRKWRKAKDVIQDDKRCAKKIVKKQDLPPAGEPMSFEYEIKSDMPGADFFLTLFVYCKKENSDEDQYCALDTTGVLENLAKRDDLRKRLEANENPDTFYEQPTSDYLTFRTTVVDSRPTALIVSVIVLSCLSITLLVLYFVYERALKKTA